MSNVKGSDEVKLPEAATEMTNPEAFDELSNAESSTEGKPEVAPERASNKRKQVNWLKFLILLGMIALILGFGCWFVLRQLEAPTNPDGHKDRVVSVAFSPDGSLLASGSWDGTAKLWEVDTGKLRATFPAGWVNSVAFSPDGKTLATAATNWLLKLWDVATGQEIATFEGGGTVIAFSPDGKSLAAGGWGGISLWEVATRKKLHFWEIDLGADAVAFSPDGKILASGGGDRKVHLWDVTTKEKVTTLKGHTGAINSIAFFPEGSGFYFISASRDKTMREWSYRAKDEKLNEDAWETFAGHTGAVSSVAVASLPLTPNPALPDRKNPFMVASGSHDATIKLWHMALVESHTLKGHTSVVAAVALTADGKNLASAGWDGTVRIWDLKTNQPHWIIWPHPEGKNKPK